MRRLIKYCLAAGVLIFGGLQFLRPTFSNPAILPGQPIEESSRMPAEIQMLVSGSCNDCHSNKTVYPWYSYLTPANWFLAGHIDEGRAELNFSEWGGYSIEKKIRKLDEICEVLSSGTMPLRSYLTLHRDAELTAEQRRLICNWSREEAGRLSTR